MSVDGRFVEQASQTMKLSENELWILYQALRIAQEDGSIEGFCSIETASILSARLLYVWRLLRARGSNG